MGVVIPLRIRKKNRDEEPREVPSKNPYEFFCTPSWCVRRLAEAIEFPAGRYLEPAVGDGAIVNAINSLYEGINWDTCDLREYQGFKADLYGDYCNFPELDLYAEAKAQWDCIITNPPYSLALPFVEHSIRRGKLVIMLLRLAWLSSEKRADFLRANTPDVYVLPNRPSFDGYGSDPKTDYGWFVWDTRVADHNRIGKLQILGSTSAAERAMK